MKFLVRVIRGCMFALGEMVRARGERDGLRFRCETTAYGRDWDGGGRGERGSRRMAS